MKKLKKAIAIMVVVLTAWGSSLACGDYGMFRLHHMDAQEFLTYDQVSIGVVTGIQTHPQDSLHPFFQVRLLENFRGKYAEGSIIVVDGKNNWRLQSAQVGDRLLFFAHTDGAKIIADQNISLIVPSEAQLERNLAATEEKYHPNTRAWHQQEEERMNGIYQHLLMLENQVVEGVNEVKSGEQLRKQFHVVDGELSGEFLAFDGHGKVRLQGHFLKGKRVGTWKYFSNGELQHEENFGPVDASVAHLKCY